MHRIMYINQGIKKVSLYYKEGKMKVSVYKEEYLCYLFPEDESEDIELADMPLWRLLYTKLIFKLFDRAQNYIWRSMYKEGENGTSR